MPKSPGEWTEDDLLSLIRDGAEEGPDLEYKRCAALQKHDPQRREISKDVSAMANSASGTIIYGMVERRGPGNSDSVLSGSRASPTPPRGGRREERGDEENETQSRGHL